MNHVAQNLNHLLSHVYLPVRKRSSTSGKKNKVLIISGPTASGKTKLSLALAKIIDGEIISADSMQVYRGMDIGTAKVSQEDRQSIPHHLIDIRNLEDNFSVVEFYNEAHEACKDICARGKVPILVGGTGFYIHAFIYGPPSGPPSDPEIRKKLEKQMEDEGPEVLYERLQILDSDYASTITERDRHKIIRGLEIIFITKRKVSDLPKPAPIHGDFDYHCWFIYLPKEILHPRIEMRCDEMIQKGFIDEVKRLAKQGLRENRSASQAIGYRQCLEYLDSNETGGDFELFVSAFKQASRQYAKRQFTWFRKEPLFRWLNVDEFDDEHVKELILQDYEQS